MARYVYEQLRTGENEIRLLTLHPGAENAPLRFKIRHASLSEDLDALAPPEFDTERIQQTLPEGWHAKETIDGRLLFMKIGIETDEGSRWAHPDPQLEQNIVHSRPRLTPDPLGYEALSYVWGSAEGSEEVLVCVPGQPDSTMLLRPQLVSALRHLRSPYEARSLWVDAVCIDQANIIERDAQVARMSQIYSRAKRVIIWFGPESPDSHLALSTLQYFASQVEFTTDEFFTDAPGAEHVDWWHPRTVLPYDDQTWQALQAFFKSTWFERVWVLQEAQLANDAAVVTWGRQEILWSSVRRAMFVLAIKDGVPEATATMLQLYVRGLVTTASRSLRHMLWWAKSRHCTDPRDKVYGILGLLSPAVLAQIQPNYGVKASDVYRDVVLAYINTTKRLDILAQCDIRERLSEGPSWVVNLAVSNTKLPLPQSLASGYSAACCKYLMPGALDVTGVSCGTVLHVYDVAIGNDSDIYAVVRAWAHAVVDNRKHETGWDEVDSFLDLIFYGRSKERFPNHLYPALQELRDWFSETGVANDVLMNFLSNQAARLRGCVMIKTDTGYLGLAQQEIRSGDVVAALLGCENPLVLRQAIVDEYTVIGPCFVQGVMHAERLLGNLPKDWMLAYSDGSRMAVPRYHNIKTQQVTSDDPRLPALGAEWRVREGKLEQDDNIEARYFEDTMTGELLNYDPRMSLEAIEAMGQPLQSFRLI